MRNSSNFNFRQSPIDILPQSEMRSTLLLGQGRLAVNLETKFVFDTSRQFRVRPHVWSRNQYEHLHDKRYHSFASTSGIMFNINILGFGKRRLYSEQIHRFITAQAQSLTNDGAISRKLTVKIVAFGKRNDWRGILETYETEGRHFNEINYATAMNQLGRIRSVDKGDARLDKLVCDIAGTMLRSDVWDVRAQVNVLHAIAKMRLYSKGAKSVVDLLLLDGVDHYKIDSANDSNNKNNATYIVANGSSQAISNTAWSCARLGIKNQTLFDAINQRAAYIVEDGSPQSIANIAWACATLDMECPALFQAIETMSSKMVEQGEVQAISNTIWAFARLGIKCPLFCRGISDYASKIVGEGLPQNIANVAWALAILGADCPLLFKAINDNAANFILDADPQAISNTAWAFAILGIEGPDLFRLIDDNATSLVSKGKSQEISNTIWAFATLRVQCPTLCFAIERQATSIVKTSDSQNIANIVWSFATLGVECPLFCKAIDSDPSCFIENASSQSMANTMWAFAILGFDCRATFHTMINRRFEYLVETCNEQEITNLCYSMVILDLVPESEAFFRAMWNRAMEIQWESVKNEGRIQLLQSFRMVSKSMDLEPPKEWFDSPVPYMVDLRESLAQRELSELLFVDLGIDHEVEASPFPQSEDDLVPGLLAIDAACRAQRLAFEFDGPSHFLRRPGTRRMPEIENGPTKAKRRFLEELGWTVVNVPFFEWAKAQTKEARKEWVLEKLRATGYHYD